MESFPQRSRPGKIIFNDASITVTTFNSGLNIEEFINFVYSQHQHNQIDREDQNRETFLLLDRTCQ